LRNKRIQSETSCYVMKPTDKPKIDTLETEQALWDVNRRIFLARGIDPAEWADEQARRFTSPDANMGFDALSKHQCTPLVLAVILALLRISPALESIWTEVVGNPKRRKKVSRNLEKIALMIEEVFADALAVEDQTIRAQYIALGRIPLSDLTSELRLYSSFVDLAKRLSADVETRSIRDFLKYILAGYVKRATGRHHDRNISALLADVVGPSDYNEVAQRMWRLRNYGRMEKHFSKFADFLFAIGVVVARTT
jgi:hypothetical protein